jgi:6-phosphogluconolactonase
MKRATARLLAIVTLASLLLAFCACSSDSDEGNGGPGTGGTGGSATGGAETGGAASGGTDTGGADTGGSASGGNETGGADTGGSGGEQSGGAGGSSGGNGSGGAPQGTPYVFVGSTDGMVRVFTMATSDGSLTPAGSLDTGSGLDFIALGPDDRTVFVSFDGSVSAYTYDPTAESLTFVDDQTTFGVGTHVAVDPTGGFVFVAHYNQGAISFLPFSQGSFGTAQKLTPGANAHQVRVDAAGKHVYVPCLGSDWVAQYDLNPTSGTLTAASPPTVGAGNGPRHLDFHPTAPVAYVVNEVASAVQVFDIDANGLLTRRPNDEVYMSPDEAFHQSSDIRVSPDGAFVYAANRQPSELVRFRVESDHSLTRLGADPLSGVVRSFGVDPAGKYLQVGGNDGRLAALKIDAATGAVTETSAETGLGDIHATVVRYLVP